MRTIELYKNFYLKKYQIIIRRFYAPVSTIINGRNASSNKVINTSHLLQIAAIETEVKINKLFVPQLLNLLDNQTRNFIASDDRNYMDTNRYVIHQRYFIIHTKFKVSDKTTVE